MNNIIGEKVVCIDAGPNPMFPHYKCPLIQGQVYVVSSFGIAPQGSGGYRLVGIIPPPDFDHQLFAVRRFRLLSEMKQEATCGKRQLVSA